jgi:hypothetical protein
MFKNEFLKILNSKIKNKNTINLLFTKNQKVIETKKID